MLQPVSPERTLYKAYTEGIPASINISTGLLPFLTSCAQALGSAKIKISETKYWKEYRREGVMNMILIYIKIRDF